MRLRKLIESTANYKLFEASKTSIDTFTQLRALQDYNYNIHIGFIDNLKTGKINPKYNDIIKDTVRKHIHKLCVDIFNFVKDLHRYQSIYMKPSKSDTLSWYINIQMNPQLRCVIRISDHRMGHTNDVGDKYYFVKSDTFFDHKLKANIHSFIDMYYNIDKG